jgi:hypothetical protein
MGHGGRCIVLQNFWRTIFLQNRDRKNIKKILTQEASWAGPLPAPDTKGPIQNWIIF